MANTSQTAPYQSLLSKQITPILVDGTEHLQTRQSYPAIDNDTSASWQLVQPLIAGINLLNEWNIDRRGGFAKPARIELYMGADSFRTRGLVIFDESDRLIVHVVNALVGYGGTGPQLSKQILSFLDVSPEIIDEIQAATSQEKGSKPYNILLVRSGYDWQWQHAIQQI